MHYVKWWDEHVSRKCLPSAHFIGKTSCKVHWSTSVIWETLLELIHLVIYQFFNKIYHINKIYET